MDTVFFVFEILGVIAFSLSGALTAMKKEMDIFGACVAAGIFAMFFFNVFENLGMNVGIMPITGLPLPFISRGGSSMVTNYISNELF